MASATKISRKKLLKEPDEFISFSGKMIQFGVQHKTKIAYALCVAVIFMVLGAGFRFFSMRSENKAQVLLDEAVVKYKIAIKDQDSKKAYQSVSENFQRIFRQYGDKDAARVGRIFFANVCFDAGEYATSIELYKRALRDFKKHPFIKNLIFSGLGYAYGQLNEDKLAASYFKEITESDEPILKDEALFNLGVLYERLSEKGKSADAFQQIITNHSDSIYIEIVKERSVGKVQ